MKRLTTVPNILSFSRIILTVLFLKLFFAEGLYSQYLALIVFGAASLTDKYDGKFARSRGACTGFGRFLDPLADKILTLSVLFALVAKSLVAAWMVQVILIREVIVTVLRTRGMRKGQPVVTSKLAKWKTGTQLVAIILILVFLSLQKTFARWGIYSPLLGDTFSHYLLNGATAVMMTLSLISALPYLRKHAK